MLEPNGECLEWTGSLNVGGYGMTSAYGKLWTTHRLALELEGVDVTGHLVLHSCDNPACCNPAHLRTGTQADNMREMVSRGRSTRGSKNPKAKLTEQQVLEIRAIRGMTYKAIADRYNTCPTRISRIMNRKSWTHI